MKTFQIKNTLFKGHVFKTCIFTLLLFCNHVFSQTTYNIDNPEDLRNVIYQPGDVIILKNGTYTTDERMRFLGSGTAENPVTFRAETPGGVIFTGGPRLTIGGESDNTTGEKIATGEYLIVDGFHWKGGYGASNFIEFRNGNDYAHHSTIQNCVIDGLGIEPSELAEDLADEQITKHRWIVLYGTYNTVINCSFMNKVSAGAIVLGEYSYNAFPVVPDGEPEINNSCAVVGHTIMNNYFYNFEKMTEKYGRKANGDELSNAGDSETIRIGTSSYQMVNSDAVVSNNYFVQSDGENEIITNKSKGNTYTNNTFRRCRGSLVLRHGSNATVDGNYFLGEDVDGTGGIRISDSNHAITNNYIQDCITVGNNAKWNNGITFIGGGANADVDCSTDNVSNGYQKTENIVLSNNTIINTNSPLFYNVNTDNNNDVKGTVANNLIYFAAGNPNVSPVISGDEPTSYSNIGSTLTYTGNVYNGTTLGETNSGFSEETGIMANVNNETFTFSGSGAEGKGANMGAYEPTTDDMVGYGIGACFIDYTGASIIDGECTIEVVESLTVSSLEPLSPDAASYDVTVNANVSWTATANDDWITIDTNSGTGNATVSISVTENADTTSRTGTVTFTQDPGGDDIERTLTVTQESAELTDLYDLINTGTGAPTDKVTVHSFSKEEVNGTSKFNYAKNTLDKDNGTVWAADDGAVLPEDYKGDGEYIIYDLSSIHSLDLIQFTTTNKSDSFGYQIWVSTTGTEDSDFTMVLPTSTDLLLTATGTTDFNTYEVDTEAQYIKLIGFGRFNSTGDTRKSQWNAIGEIEFYGSESLSVNDNQLSNLNIYPNPAKNSIKIEHLNATITSLSIYSIQGRKVLEQSLKHSDSKIEVNISSLVNGLYLLTIKDENGTQASRKIVVSK
ncbi:chondroitinase-B domain-containing protein [Algibacter sp. AS12]|uniref:chondroitinase-B domain-containing protein n=1 Tax=Algibacter sp. AS12 TaxID=3135773 RepID=UPI00398A80E9